MHIYIYIHIVQAGQQFNRFIRLYCSMHIVGLRWWVQMKVKYVSYYIYTHMYIYIYIHTYIHLIVWHIEMVYVLKLLRPSLVALAAGVALVDQVPAACTTTDKDLTSQGLGIIHQSLDQIGQGVWHCFLTCMWLWWYTLHEYPYMCIYILFKINE